MSAPMFVFPQVHVGLGPLCWKFLSKYSFSKANTVRRYCSNNQKAQALIYSQYGDPTNVFELREMELPSVESNCVKIKMLASPINPADLNTVQGVYPVKPQLPAVGGFEGVGEVMEVGSEVTQVKPGDRVIPAVNTLGTWRSHLVCPADHVMSIAQDAPLLVAASLRVNMCTAYRMLSDYVELRTGDCVVQNAANSGAGQAAIQIAAARGLKTLNIIRDRPDLAEVKSFLHELGATAVTTEESLKGKNIDDLLKEHDIPRPKLALNAVGGKSVISLIKLMEQGGTIVTYGGMSKQPIIVPTGSLIFNDIKLVGYWMTRWHDQNANGDEAKKMISRLCQWAKSGQLRAPSHRLVPITDYASALDAALTPYTLQKQILTFDS